jgi:MFS family permease
MDENNTAGLRFYGPFMPIFLGLFCCHLGVGASLSVLPFYVKQVLGGSDVDIGTVIAAIAVAVVLTRPIAGRISDRVGHKVLMLTGALFCAAAGAAYAVSSSIGALTVVRLLHGVGEGCAFTAGATWLVAMAPATRRGKIIGLYGVSMWSGVTLGALAGAIVMKAAGFSAVWYLCALMPVIGLLMIAIKQAPAQAPGGKKSALFPATAFLPGIALAMASMGYAALASFAALYLSSKGIADGVLAFNVFGFAYVGSRLFLGHWPDQLGPYRVALWSAAVEAIGLALLSVAPNLAVAVAGGLAMGLGLSLLYPSLALIVVRNTDASQHGAALGMFTSFWDLGIALGSTIAGFIGSQFGYSMIYVTMLVATGLSALTMLCWVTPRRTAVASQP